MSRKPYLSDVTDAEWNLLEPLIPPVKPGGRPRSTEMREVVSGVFYALKGGIPWRMLPHEFPPWQTVYDDFNDWRKAGVWETLNASLREACRRREGREATPSAAIVDSQSVKTTQKGALGATTEARRSPVASGRSSWIPSAY